MNLFDVDGKVALVTGAGRGIGLAVAQVLHARGARIVLVDADSGSLQRVAADFGAGALPVVADVRDRAAMRAVVDEAVAHFGGLDVVVANAGVSPTPATLRTMADEDFDRVIGINLTGTYNTISPALDQIVTRRGHVVVVSSVAAFSPGAGGAPYMISKAAVAQLGRALRIELAAHGASAGVSYFGVVETDMTHDMFDADELGREINALLPWPLNRRISTHAAAEVIADGIARRAAETCAPAGWRQFKWLQGLINPVLDRRLVKDAGLHRLLRRVEAESTAAGRPSSDS